MILSKPKFDTRQGGRRTDAAAGPPDANAERGIRQAVDAVCDELGVSASQGDRRAAIERRMHLAYRHGLRQPLNLVHAGLEESA